MTKGTQKQSFVKEVTSVEARDSGAGSELGESLMAEVMSKPSMAERLRHAESKPIDGVIIGRLVEITDPSQVLVSYPGAPEDIPVPAVNTAKIAAEDAGRQVALSFIGGNAAQPVILGLVQNPDTRAERMASGSLDVQVDGETLTLTADREIVLRCGKSSVTLTRAGKIILKGEYLSSHSKGVNRIKGGSVQVN